MPFHKLIFVDISCKLCLSFIPIYFTLKKEDTVHLLLFENKTIWVEELLNKCCIKYSAMAINRYYKSKGENKSKIYYSSECLSLERVS